MAIPFTHTNQFLFTKLIHLYFSGNNEVPCWPHTIQKINEMLSCLEAENAWFVSLTISSL